MTHQYIIIDKKKYAVGLFWQPVAVDAAARNYARELASAVDKKLNLFTEYRAMIALGSKRSGHRSGMPSAAAEVMEAFAEFSSFLAAFVTDDGSYYIVAVRNGIILEDKIFRREDQARAHYAELAAIPDWGAFFAPESWAMPRAVQRRLDEIVTGRARAVLHYIGRVRTNLLSLAIFTVFALGLLYFFRGPITQMLTPRPQVSTINPELAAEYKRRIEEKNRELDAAYEIEKTPPPQPLQMPYDNLPDPIARAQLCYQAIGFLMQPVPGWVQKSAECGETHASVDLQRTFGTIGGFYEYGDTVMPGALVQEKSESEISVRAKLPTQPPVASIDERDGDTIMRDVMTAFQGIDTPVDIELVVDTITNGIETANLPVVEVAASSKLVPMQFMQIFEPFGGVYMTRCAWNAATKTWNYEVIIYAK